MHARRPEDEAQPQELSAVPASNRQAVAVIERPQLREDFLRVRAATESLTAGLSAEDQNLQSMPETSPVKWHRAHTSWFFEAFVLAEHDGKWDPSPDAWHYLFNSYYNELGRQYPRPQRGLISRPDVAEVTRYRNRVDNAVLGLIERCPDDRWPEVAALLRLGLNHEQQHQELIVTDLKHGLSHNPLSPAWFEREHVACPPAAPPGWIRFEERIARIGMAGEGFCFDNEGPRHRQVVEAFELASRPVTCGEYLDFMTDGGYDDPALWLSDGWSWLQASGTRAPLYWRCIDGQWHIYTLAGLRPVDPGETLTHVSFYEACAYAQWAHARLPSEAEWEVAASGCGDLSGPFAESAQFHPAGADAGAAPGDFSRLVGNVWEWTTSSYAPYPGYEMPPGAVGEYNGKFMANQMVLRGGSCATPVGHVRPSYRNFFYPPDRWQFTGLRLARNA